MIEKLTYKMFFVKCFVGNSHRKFIIEKSYKTFHNRNFIAEKLKKISMQKTLIEHFWL